MKQIFFYLIALGVLGSCSESYNTLDPKEFNGKIAGRTDIETPEELIRVYYRVDQMEDTFGISIETVELETDRYEITLIEEVRDDDELAGLKTVLFAKRTGQTWTVTEIRKNWKNWSGYGHTDWGT